MTLVHLFFDWWNGLAAKNDKIAFRNQREAADFVRRVHNKSGGPNEEMLRMRKAYKEALSARKSEAAIEPSDRQAA